MRVHATLKLSLRLISSKSSYHCSEICHLMAKTTRLKRSIHWLESDSEYEGDWGSQWRMDMTVENVEIGYDSSYEGV